MRYLEHDDPPDYEHEDPYAEEHAEAQAELAAIEAEEIEPLHQWRPARDLDGEPIDRIEAEEAHDRAGEAWYEATYGQGGTS